ncbi:hypothetical protein [Kitasatospora albolonga]|uniref:hypothetical protein n=1 Tax=Kitasatospora albolonga TaxID=68173 RepID=UPI003CD05448
MRDPRRPVQLPLLPPGAGPAGRLHHPESFYPTRLEFHDYLEWCAAEFTDAGGLRPHARSRSAARGRGGAARWRWRS